MQPEDTYMRIILNPQNKQAEWIQQYIPTQKLSQHHLSSLKSFSHETGMGNDEL